MTLSNTEWYIRIDSWTHGWHYETFEDDPAPNGGVWTSPVWIAAEGFSLEWAFAADLSPSDLDASVFGFALRCQTPADVPAIDVGDVIEVALRIPSTVLVRNADGSITGAVSFPEGCSQTFQVTDVSAVEAATGGITVTVTCTTAIRDINIDLSTFLGAFGYTYWQQHSDALASSQPEGQLALDTIIGDIVADEMGLPYSYQSIGITGYRGAGLRIKADEPIGLLALVQNAHALWYGPAGSPGHAHGYAAIAKVVTRFDGGYEVSTLIWDPEARGNQAAPFELTYVGSVLSTALQSGYTAVGGASGGNPSTLAFVDGDYVRSAPPWQKSGQSVVDVIEFKGFRRDTDGESLARSGAGDIGSTNRGLMIRNFDTICYIVNPSVPGAGFITYGGKPVAELCNFGVDRDRHAWAVKEFDVLPRLMTDAVWQELFDTFAMPWTGQEAAQRTIVLVNADDDKNLTEGDAIWATVMGCKFTIERGHLVLTPTTRPFHPVAINGITDAVTFAQMTSTYPTATIAQCDDSLTIALAGVSTI